MNTSATGGYLQPATVELNDDELDDLLQSWFAGVSGLDGSLVRPLWQPEPPPTPDATVTWMAFGIKNRPRDWDAFVTHVTDEASPDGADALYRNEEFKVQCVVYGPKSSAACAAIWNNSRIAQNREALQNASIVLIEVGDPLQMAEYIKESWVRRYDFDVRLRRPVSLRYPVLDVVSVAVSLTTEDPARTSTFEVEQEGFGVSGFGVGTF